MKKTNTDYARRMILIITVAYLLGLSVLAERLSFGLVFIIWMGAMIPIILLYRSWSAVLEMSMLPIIWLFVSPLESQLGPSWYLLLVSTVTLSISHRMNSRRATIFSLWFSLGLGLLLTYNYQTGIVGSILLAIILLWLAFYSLKIIRGTYAYKPPKMIDLILCSFSGNTGHYAHAFIESARENGAEVIVHRFHYYKDFDPVLKGDALVLAFPVSGWKPPWPLTEFLIKKLKKGDGKPAFLLYTAAGGPENAGIIAWILLTLKGYKVIGRAWSIYPLNIPTFRLGPKKLWQFIDSLTPLKSDIEFVQQAAQEFVSGGGGGLPFVMWPTPLVLIGFLLDNKWINAILYRTYVWRKRCTTCNFCLRYCPVNRFVSINGRPKAKGTCSLCFGCVNHCPKNSMQMRFLSEYGQPYKSRWPQFIIKPEAKREPPSFSA
ncbi:hypothetical protein [Candidatus Formimonas warabiya]|uniref:4Fe-4S ferredoxin-type domain-containing protein n=1 Tax=Formimonas warabiya TaxID=1761012 RepID=A0A3G1KRM3_FORW1|nr:hypothetical protein [Candidatus Formimonas warabiya]ATW25096.1 hypothetical protein DCMF_10195 [Candidatus Formimonas warabiya]